MMIEFVYFYDIATKKYGDLIYLQPLYSNQKIKIKIQLQPLRACL